MKLYLSGGGAGKQNLFAYNSFFNSIDKTWDCPCHASRFDIDGKCLSGPSNRGIEIKENN